MSKQALSGGGSWDYDHMSHWGDDYSMCYTKDQSPIDIHTDSVKYDSSVCSNEFEWDVDTSVENYKITNNGHSIVLTPVEAIQYYDEAEEDGAIVLADNSTYRTLTLSDDAIASFTNYFMPEDSEHERFCFHSLHFHWGTTSKTGSEHLVDGHQYPLEVHFVHYSCSHASLGLTLGQFGTGAEVDTMKATGADVHQLGVVGFFFEISEEDNPAFESLFGDADKMDRYEEPLAEGEELSELDFIDDFSLADLIPVDYPTAGYYAYEGSLTTPPCTNIVRWHVMNAKASISEAQMEKFRDLLTANGEHSQAPNYREVQSNPNTVYGCMDAKKITDDRSPTAIALVWVLFVVAFTMPCCLFCICYYQAHKERVLTTDSKAAPMVHSTGH